MAYAYWKNGKRNDHAVFDLFFRRSPFRGEYTIFAGLGECVKFLQSFKYSKSGNINRFWQILQTILESSRVMSNKN